MEDKTLAVAARKAGEAMLIEDLIGWQNEDGREGDAMMVTWGSSTEPFFYYDGQGKIQEGRVPCGDHIAAGSTTTVAVPFMDEESLGPYWVWNLVLNAAHGFGRYIVEGAEIGGLYRAIEEAAQRTHCPEPRVLVPHERLEELGPVVFTSGASALGMVMPSNSAIVYDPRRALGVGWWKDGVRTMIACPAHYALVLLND